MRVIGAGLPRTGTTSLREALAQLTGEPCYHMDAVMERLDTDVHRWLRALDGEPGALEEVMEGFGSAVDWPASSFFEELMAIHPDAIVLLSRRADTDTWWRSADKTVWQAMREPFGWDEWDAMTAGLGERLGVTDFASESIGKAAYDAHNQRVRDTVPADRLVEWEPGDGWEPLCTALGVPVPDAPFPKRNDTAEFRKQAGWD